MEKRKIISIASGVIFIFAVLFIILSLINIPGMKKTESKLNKTADIRAQEILQDSRVIKQVKEVLHSYSTVLNRHSTDSIGMYFADSLKRFYLQENVKNKFIADYYNSYWAKFPESTIQYHFDDILIDVSKKNDIQVVLQGEHHRDRKNIFHFLAHFRLNNQLKIYYLRDFKSS